MEARLEAERKAREEARLAEEAQRRAEEAERRIEAEARAEAIAKEEIEEDKLTPDEKRIRNERQAILDLIDQKPAEVAWLVKTWLIEDE